MKECHQANRKLLVLKFVDTCLQDRIQVLLDSSPDSTLMVTSEAIQKKGTVYRKHVQRAFKYFLFKSKYHLSTLFSTQNGLELVEIGDTEDKLKLCTLVFMHTLSILP